MERQTWKILYAAYEGPEARAVEFLSREMGTYLTRDEDIYAFRVIPCEKIGAAAGENAVILGTWDEYPGFASVFDREKIGKGGYGVRICENPAYPDGRLVYLCGDTPAAVFYAAVDFVDDVLTDEAPVYDASIHFKNELFTCPLALCETYQTPAVDTRSVFTWGHPIDNVREYFFRLARMKINEVILWNDYLPLNAAEVVEIAHSYGISVIWGYSWGWSFSVGQTDLSAPGALAALQEKILAEYRASYAQAPGDGIYFQSFTEIEQDAIGGVNIAAAVTELVNRTAAALLAEYPGLRLIFGLHASSVRGHLDTLAATDPRVEILWEDLGGFPYKAYPTFNDFTDMASFKAAQLPFVDRLYSLRAAGGCGIVCKCMLTMDWSRGRVVHQAGPYVLGNASAPTRAHDARLTEKIWRFYSASWVEDGKYAYELVRHITEKTGGHTRLCLAGNFIDKIYFPTALCAEAFWNTARPYEETRKRVLLRDWVNM